MVLQSELPAPQNALFIYGGILLLALAVIGAALFVLSRRNSQSDNRPARRAGSPALDATMVFHVERSGGKRPPANFTVSLPDDDGTYLIPLLDDAGTPGPPIRIRGNSLYIGRDQARAQIVFSDPSVSRLHARLIEEGDGVFILHDEGSASGTFVNDERVDLQPRQLKSGDLIEFGRQRVIFQSADPLFNTVSTFQLES